MTARYVPILKGKQGELRALKECYGPTMSGMTPLLEVVPWEPDDTDPGQDVQEVQRTVKKFAEAWPASREPLLVDASDVEREPDIEVQDPASLEVRIIDGLRALGTSAEPVVRVSALDTYLDQVAHCVERHESGAAIRITAEDLDDVVTPLGDLVERTTSRLGLSAERVDMIMDFGAVPDDGAMAMAARLARFVLPQLTSQPWRTFVLASGAFPANLGEVPPYSIGELPRRDAQLWRSLSSFQLGHGLDFGDYAVTHPLLPLGAAFAAPPQLRYTVDDHWLAIKGRRQDRRGHEQFFDICAEILVRLGAGAAGRDESWGDEYIHDAAAISAGLSDPLRGTGNAATWRAIATSHHLAYVVKRLSEGGAP